MNRKRLRAGVPTIFFCERPVVAADAISLLSGVNFGSVEKVLAAIHALHGFTGTTAQELVRLSDVPLERVYVGEPGSALRAANTLHLCEELVDSGKFDDLDPILKLRGRFEG